MKGKPKNYIIIILRHFINYCDDKIEILTLYYITANIIRDTAY